MTTLTTITTLADVERTFILQTLEKFGGNRTHTARTLGISLRTLQRRLTEYNQAGYAVPKGLSGKRRA